MTTFYHLTNVRTPLDATAQDMLTVLGRDYRLSLPIEADPIPDITPVPQATMVNNGIIGVYVSLDVVSREALRPHWPAGLMDLSARPSITPTDG